MEQDDRTCHAAQDDSGRIFPWSERAARIGGSVDVIEGPPSRIDPNQFIRRHEAHAKRRMIGQLLYFQFVRLNETFHDGQTASMIEGVHRM